jgi:hypothetical protein
MKISNVTYSFINMLFISTGIFYDKLRQQILSVDTTANSPLRVAGIFDEQRKPVTGTVRERVHRGHQPTHVRH